MAQILAESENVQRQPKLTIPKTGIADWDVSLYSYWLQKIALNPKFYDDAKTNHGHCRCCSRILPEERKKK